MSEVQTIEPKKIGLTLRQRKYRANRLKGMSQYNAARAAGYSESYCKVACRLEKSGKVSIADLAEQMGVTDQFIVDYIQKAIEAEKVISVESDRAKDNGLMEWVKITVPDWQSRHKFMETLLKLTERIKPANVTINDNSKHVTQIFLSDKLKQARERVKNAREAISG